MYSRTDLRRMGFAFCGNYSDVRRVSIDIDGVSKEIEVVAIVDEGPNVTYLFPINKTYRAIVAIAEEGWSKIQNRAINDMNA